MKGYNLALERERFCAIRSVDAFWRIEGEDVAKSSSPDRNVEAVPASYAAEERVMTDVKALGVAEAIQEDIRRAVRILKEGGCSEIFLFGSAAAGEFGERSDIDLAVRGCPKGSFFHLLGRLLWELDHSVDLVNLDSQDAFADYLQKEGVFVRVG